MQFYSSFFLILCKRLQLSAGAELNLFSDLRLQAKHGVQGLGRYLMSVGNNLKLPHFDLIRCSAQAAELFILPEAVPMGFGAPGRKLHFHFALLSFYFLPLGSSAAAWLPSSTQVWVKVTGREYWQRKITPACFLIFYL